MVGGRLPCEMALTCESGSAEWLLVLFVAHDQTLPCTNPCPVAATIKLANDFFTVNVAPPEPVPVEQLRQQEMQLQHEAAGLLQRGKAQRGRPQTTQRQPYGQREGRPREQYGQRGGQQQWRDHRRDGNGRPSYDRRGGGGGSQQRRGGGRPQQQWQQRPGGGQSGDLRGWPDN